MGMSQNLYNPKHFFGGLPAYLTKNSRQFVAPKRPESRHTHKANCTETLHSFAQGSLYDLPPPINALFQKIPQI